MLYINTLTIYDLKCFYLLIYFHEPYFVYYFFNIQYIHILNQIKYKLINKSIIYYLNHYLFINHLNQSIHPSIYILQHDQTTIKSNQKRRLLLIVNILINYDAHIQKQKIIII